MKKEFRGWTRREFLKGTVVGMASLPSLSPARMLGKRRDELARVALVVTSERRTGVHEVLQMLDVPSVKGKSVLLKPNFNTADPCPGSTHNDTLSQIVQELHDRGAKSITVGERSGPPLTQKVLEKKGIPELAKELDFQIIDFETLKQEDWVHLNPPGNHWKNGFFIARPAAEAEYFVSTCCLKTHQYGGIFTMSLKLAVGLTPKSLMRELHGNKVHMRRMIAEINSGYTPQVIILDGIEAFVDGGPMTGLRKRADLFLGSCDRVALDAAGLAVLKNLGSNRAIMETKIFEQEQIARAVELGQGVAHPDQVEFVTQDRKSRLMAETLKSVLSSG